MMRRLFPALLMAMASPALAQDAPPLCDKPAPLEAPWSAWASPAKANAGGTLAAAPALTLGKAAAVTLQPMAQVTFSAPPSRNDAATFGGLFSLTTRTAGRVGIALSGAAWIDVVEGTAALKSVEHGHGPDCSGIRKIVWFDLKPGRYTVQIAGSATPDIRVMTAIK